MATAPTGARPTPERILNISNAYQQSAALLVSTDAGDAYTWSEYQAIFRNAGFAETTLHQVPGMPQQAMVSRKAP